MLANDNAIEPVEFNEALSKRYLAYALSTIMSRSLPDVRDGLKPVHRRLLYAMYELKLNPKNGFKKCARVVGDVMGKFHPHGDAAIYDALVRLAQDFSVRYPLIDGQGNFGNIDGDSAAAMRYTEARLTEIATLLMDGIDENTIDFSPTYDGESQEPQVFPSAFPNLLANGSSGIAVGMATSIPPHNLYELCQALIALLKKDDLSNAELLNYIPGPDFPTGGILVESKENILKAYTTGRGSFRLRAAFEKEDVKGGGYRLIITEIPYQVQKSKLLEKIADLMHQKKLPLLANMMDESSEDIRIVLEPKSRNVDPALLMESLYRQTDLDVRIPLNMNVLTSSKKPAVLPLKIVLKEFINHRIQVLQRRSQNRLSEINNRLEILEGYLVAYLNIDEVIQIIRDHDDPKSEMINRFHLTENQVEAILNMRLRSLRKLQEIEIKDEHKKLSDEKQVLEALLASDDLQKKKLKDSFSEIQKKYPLSSALGRRRTVIGDTPEVLDFSMDEEVEIEPVTIICSEKGWIRCLKGHVKAEDLKYKEGDNERFVIFCQSNQKLCLFSTKGRAYTLLPDKLPGGRSQGESVRLLIDLAPGEEVVALYALSSQNDQHFLIVSKKARGFRVQSNTLISQTRQGKQIFNCPDDDDVFGCFLCYGDSLAIIGTNRKLLVQPIEDIPVMSRGQGVALQKYKDPKTILSDMLIFNREDGLTWRRGLQMVNEKNLMLWHGKRAASGRLAPLGFPRSNTFKG